MSHIKAETPPACDEDCPHTHDALVAKSLTIKAADGGANVVITTSGGVAGIWVSTGCGNECVGLVAQPGAGAYVVLYGEHADGLPPVAFCPDHIQLRDEKDHGRPIILSYADLLSAVSQAPHAE